VLFIVRLEDLIANNITRHLFIRGETFLRSFDPMVQETLTKAYEDAGVIIHKKSAAFTKVERLDQTSGTIQKSAHEKRTEGPSPDKLLRLTDENGETFEVNELLWAVGRKPEIDALDIGVTGVKLSKKGHIEVDEFQNTNVNGIYALGDVTGKAELTPGTLCKISWRRT
jgi:glutathione reductase (NADPH)